MNLTDLLFGNNHHSAKDRMHLRNRSGEPVTLTKEIYYTIRDGNSRIHVTGYDDLSEHCSFARYSQRSSKPV